MPTQPGWNSQFLQSFFKDMSLSKREEGIKGSATSTFRIAGKSTLTGLCEQVKLTCWLARKAKEDVLDEPFSRKNMNRFGRVVDTTEFWSQTNSVQVPALTTHRDDILSFVP